MANRILAHADDNPGEILEDGELHKIGMWDEITIERGAAGAPGLLFVMTRYENDVPFDRMVVYVPDGAAFLAPVNNWLKGNDPMPWVAGNDRATRNWMHAYRFDPRPEFNQNREDYA